ncbi:MAG: universal stress protein [Pseudomonadota bacterium]|nr:universal stress protein [Pseudomonadota bacterium]
MSQYQHLLLATDFSELCASVEHKAAEEARLRGAELSIIHVVEYLPQIYMDDITLPPDPEIEQNMVKNARKQMLQVADRIGFPDAKQIVVSGSPKQGIVRYAKDSGVDLIVVGSHGRHGISLLLGSTANGVLHQAPCDVLAVRMRQHES